MITLYTLIINQYYSIFAVFCLIINTNWHYSLLFRSHVGTITVGDDDEETQQGQHKRQVDGRHTEKFLLVNDGSLQRGEHATAKYGHDQTCGTEFGIVAQTL